MDRKCRLWLSQHHISWEQCHGQQWHTEVGHTHPCDADFRLHKRKENKREIFALSILWHSFQHLGIWIISLFFVSLFIIAYILNLSLSFPNRVSVIFKKEIKFLELHTLEGTHWDNQVVCCFLSIAIPVHSVVARAMCSCQSVCMHMCSVLPCSSLNKGLMPKFGGQNDLSIHKPALPLPTWRPRER